MPGCLPDPPRGESGRYGMVVVGWLGRASTTLHYTHHVSHAGSRDTAVSFLFAFLCTFSSFDDPV